MFVGRPTGIGARAELAPYKRQFANIPHGMTEGQAFAWRNTGPAIHGGETAAYLTASGVPMVGPIQYQERWLSPVWKWKTQEEPAFLREKARLQAELRALPAAQAEAGDQSDSGRSWLWLLPLALVLTV